MTLNIFAIMFHFQSEAMVNGTGRFYVVVVSRTAYTTILPFRSPGSSTYCPALNLLFLQGYWVGTPFPDITGHIIEAPCIGFLLADSMKPVPAVVLVPGHLVGII